MAKKRNRSSRARRTLRRVGRRAKRGFTLPLLPIIGILPGATRVWEYRRDPKEAAAVASRVYTGYDPAARVWRAEYLKDGMLPLVVGLMAHKVVTQLGANRALAAANVPIFRL